MRTERIKLYQLISNLFFLLLVFFACFFSVTADYLFFKTPLLDQVHFFLGCTILMFIPFAMVLISAYFLLKPPYRKRIKDTITSLIFSLIFFTFAFNFISYNFGPFNDLTLYLSLFFGILLGSIIFIPKVINKEVSAARLKFLTMPLLPLGFITFLVLASPQYISRLQSNYPKNFKNLVLIILDGFSTYEMPIYNSTIKYPLFEELAEKGVLYKNMYTNHTYTAGYFASLFTGHREYPGVATDKECGNSRYYSLFNILQDNGINARWSVRHPNAIPEASIVPFSYKGLRSNYLNHHLSWIPYILGLNYHVYRFTGTRSKDSPLVKLIYNFLDVNSNTNLREYFQTEVERLRNNKNPFFLLIHTNSFAEANLSTDISLQQKELWEEASTIGGDDSEVSTYSNTNEYTYLEKHQATVERMKKYNQIGLRAGIKIINEIVRLAELNKWDRDTLLIVSADHGKIFRNGKLNYGYHNEEDVTRVLTLLFNHKTKGINTDLRETIDLTRTITDYFEIKKPLNKKSVSLFTSEKKDYVTSLTLNSVLRSSWIMNLYFKDDKGNIIKHESNLRRKGANRISMVRGHDTYKYKLSNLGDAFPVNDWLKDAYHSYCFKMQ